MHRIPNNPSPFDAQQSVSGAEEAHPSSGNMRRSRSLSQLDSSPLAKRRRGDVGEAQKSHLGSLNRARFNDGDAGIANLDKDKIITELNSLMIDDSNIHFNEAFEATYPSYQGDWRLNSDFFPSEMSCDSESQERLEEREENQSDSAEGSSTNLHTPHTDDSLADEEGERSLEGEPKANHAALSCNDVQAVEENTAQQAKLKSAKYAKWTPVLKKMARNIIQANADRKLSGRKLHALLEAACDAQNPQLVCPGYESFLGKFLGKSHETYAKWTPELKKMARNIIQANADRKLSGKKLHDLLKEECDAHNPKLACPGYKSFQLNFLEKSRESSVQWTTELIGIAQELIQANANAEPKPKGTELYALLTATCDVHDPQLVCPGYKSFLKNFLAKPRNPGAMDV